MIVVSWADQGKTHAVPAAQTHAEAFVVNHKTACGLRTRRTRSSASFSQDAQVTCKRCLRSRRSAPNFC